jgi:hypothetical protein
MSALSEQETTINYNREEKTADVWTSDRTVMTKLDRLCETAPENYRCIDIAKTRDGELISKQYTIADKSLLSFRSKKVKVSLSEEQKQANAERLRQARAQKG